MNTAFKTISFLLVLSLAGVAYADETPTTETNCHNWADDDGDGLADCGDADCATAPNCLADGGPENTDLRCSDWIDNDRDGHVDCDDKDCESGVVTVCHGSWQKRPTAGPGAPMAPAATTTAPAEQDMPTLEEGETVEDLIGRYGDIDGERNDFLCSDGFDNDGDGKIDCADFGCRFDPNVTICRGNPGMRFSIVGNVAFNYDFNEEEFDVRFTKLQLRSFGPIPLIQDSFYLVSMRAEKTPRLTFAMFQIPLGGGHFLNINSGGGGLSNGMVLSSAKNLLLNPPYYLFSAFDQGNSAAVEASGPVDTDGVVQYRAYVAGGSGLFTGNVGGRYFGFDNDNFTYGGGVSFQFNIVGRYNRWDTQFLYGLAPLTIAAALGVKFDQRAQERYVAANARFVLRWNRLIFSAENFTKRELEFESWQTAYNVMAGVLLWPKHLMFGVDFGQFLPFEMENAPETLETELKRQMEETQFRAALHWYFYRNVGVASLVFTERYVETGDPETEHERNIRLEFQYRF